MDTTGRMDSSEKSVLTLANIVKFVGALGVMIPVLLGYFEYRRAVEQDRDVKFRAIVEKLSSDKKAERVAAATNLGTYLKVDEKYYVEALNILINTLSIELDYNVLNAIRASLENVGIEQRKKIIQQLLTIDRNFFIYDYPLKTWLTNSETDLQRSEDKARDIGVLIANESVEAKKLLVQNLGEELNIKGKIKNSIEKDYNELAVHKSLVTSFTGLFLDFSRSTPIENLEFYQNGFNFLTLSDLNIPKSFMISSAFSSSNLTNIDLSSSIIEGTTFAYSNFSNCNLSGCKITATNFNGIKIIKGTDFRKAILEDVFFLGADLKNADFTGAVGLKPMYFYRANNLDLAHFDAAFEQALEQSNITDAEFREYVRNCKLSNQRADELLSSLDKLAPSSFSEISDLLGK